MVAHTRSYKKKEIMKAWNKIHVNNIKSLDMDEGYVNLHENSLGSDTGAMGDEIMDWSVTEDKGAGIGIELTAQLKNPNEEDHNHGKL